MSFGFRVPITESHGKNIPRSKIFEKESYSKRLGKEIQYAKTLSDDFLRGYIDSYERHGFSKVRRTLQKLLGSKEEGNGDPVKIVAYKILLGERN